MQNMLTYGMESSLMLCSHGCITQLAALKLTCFLRAIVHVDSKTADPGGRSLAGMVGSNPPSPGKKSVCRSVVNFLRSQV